MENKEYMKALREQYEKYGDFAFLEGKIQAFIKAYGYDIESSKVRQDLEKIVKWNELVNKIPVINNVQSYLNTLELFYAEFGDNMLTLEMRNEFVSIFLLDTKFQIDSEALEYDILEIKKRKSNGKNNCQVDMPEIKNEKEKGMNRHQTYLELLKQYYKKYGDEMFSSSRLQEFTNDCVSRKLTIPSYGISQDLREIKKMVKQQAQNTQNKARSNYISNEAKTITDYQSYLNALKRYYSQCGRKMSSSQVQNFIIRYQLDSRFNIQPDDVVKDLKEIETKSNISPIQPQSKQNQTKSTTPPVQSQSILDEQKLFYYIKSKPVKWEFGNPNALQNEALKKLCTVFLSSESVSNILSPERCANMELIIQQKRARTPRAADYNKVIDVNILYELYKYSYLMTTFQVLENRKNDTMKIDRVKLWDLIQGDCRKRLENLEQEKRNNPTIRNMFQKYEYDTAKIKMVVNDYVEPREYDYIYASLMTNTLLAIIMDCVLNGEADIGNGYQPILQIIKQYSAGDLMAALDASLNSVVNFTLGMYANGGKIPRRPQ